MSDKSFEKMELDQFYKLVDNVIEDLEKGVIKGEDVKPRHKIKTIEDTIIRSTETEEGEYTSNLESAEVIGKVGKRMVVVTPEDGSKPTVYGSPSVAAREVNLTPTTIKVRCDNNKVDSKGNTWSYQEV